MKINAFLTIFLAANLTACSSSNVIERTAYVKSRTLPLLNIPENMDFVELKPAYPVPKLSENASSIQGLSAEELELIKTAPNLLNLPNN